MNNFSELSASELDALLSGCDNLISMLSNASAMLRLMISDVNWAGFYALIGKKLVLYPFQGKPACIEIPLGKGVCGTAAAMGKPIAVSNVHEFSGHIACDADSNSEIVIPLYADERLVGVLDIDSQTIGRFSEADIDKITTLAKIIEKHWERCE